MPRGSRSCFINLKMEDGMYLVGLLLLILSVLLSPVDSSLVSDLLQNYEKRQLPRVDNSQPVVVEFGIALQQIIELDQKTQVLTLNVWMRHFWTDPNLTWNPDDYDGAKVAYIPPDEHWKPDIIFYDSINGDQPDSYEHIPTTVYYDGNVSFLYPTITKATCPQDVYKFPMDTQTCTLQFGSWALDGSSLDLRLWGEQAADYSKDYSKRNSEWEVKQFTATRNTAHYPCCPNPYYDVTFTLVVYRHWEMIFMYLFIPNMFVNILTVLQFLLPCDSSERITLGITLFLGVIVYLLLLNGVLPNNERLPIIIIYMSITLILNGASQCFTIFILWLHHNGNHDNHMALPHWAREYILHGLAKILLMERCITSDDEHETKLEQYHSKTNIMPDDNEELTDEDLNCDPFSGYNLQTPRVSLRRSTLTISNIKDNTGLLILRILKHMEDHRERISDDDRDSELRCEWMQVAMVFDRLLFWIYLVVTFILVVYVYSCLR